MGAGTLAITGERRKLTERVTGTVRIGLLGTLSVNDEAGRPVRVGGHRVRLLLILLALDAGRVVPAYSLIERLWDDNPPANAGNSLQSAVSRLRASLRSAGLGEDVIESHPAGYRLAIPPRDVDAMAFQDLARTGGQALASGDPVTAKRVLTEALSSWRGPALADAADAAFAAGPAARLEELHTRAALDLAEADLALGESDSLIGELRAMIAADPVAERPRGLLMRALYAAGRQAEALAVYAQTRELLADRLGVDPSPQLEQIHLSVLRQDLPQVPRRPPGQAPDGVAREDGGPSAPARLPSRDAPHSLPPDGLRKPLTSFVGRDEDVARVQEMLAECRLVTLTGPGGVGKTRLAVELAALLAGNQAAGPAGEPGETVPDECCQVRFVDLTPVTEPAEVPYAVLHTLGIRERPVIARSGAGQPGVPPAPEQRLVTALAQGRHLLVLDNCEHVVEAAATLTDQLLAGCVRLRVLATSREPLRISGEALWSVPPLPAPPEPGRPAAAASPADAGGQTAHLAGAHPGVAPDGPGAEDVAGYAAVRLLADRAAAVRPGFRVDASNGADVARICRALDGMPLAIELAAARLRTLSAAQLAQRLDARFELLTGGSRTAVPRHQTLRAVVAWSWDLLSGPEQVLARRLAVFPGGATLTAAEHVCQDAALPAGTTLSAMFGLVEKSLVSVDSSDDPRYRMLETVRAYCTERLAESGEADRVRHAFASYFLQLAETADPLLRSAEQQTWMSRLTAEQDNIHAALRWAIDRREAAMAHRFGQALGWFWLLRGLRQESAALSREILAISEPGPGGQNPDAVRARAICALTILNACWDIAEVRQPLADAEPLLVPGPQNGADPGSGGSPPHPLMVMGGAMLAVYGDRDPERALRILAAQFSSADPWTRWGARLMHAFFSMSLGRMDNVAAECAEALAGFRVIGDRWSTALALVGQAELASLDGDHARAITTAEEAAELSRSLTSWEDAAQMHAHLAKSRSRLGDHQGALADLSRAEQIARGLGEPEGDLYVTHTRAELAWLRGDLAEASDICRRLDSRLAGKPTAIGGSFRALVLLRGGLADLRTGDGIGGRATLASALRLARDGQDRSAVAAVMDALAAAVLWADASQARAERAAVMLGAAHSARGAFDHASLDAPEAVGTARRTLGDEAFETAYRQGRELGYGAALALAEDCVHSAGGE